MFHGLKVRCVVVSVSATLSLSPARWTVLMLLVSAMRLYFLREGVGRLKVTPYPSSPTPTLPPKRFVCRDFLECHSQAGLEVRFQCLRIDPSSRLDRVYDTRVSSASWSDGT